jgi:hypothetical protein
MPRVTVLPVPDINNHSGGEGKGNNFAGMSLTEIKLVGIDISARSWVVIRPERAVDLARFLVLIPKISRSFENTVTGSIGHGVGILARPPNQAEMCKGSPPNVQIHPVECFVFNSLRKMGCLFEITGWQENISTWYQRYRKAYRKQCFGDNAKTVGRMVRQRLHHNQNQTS